MPILHVKALTQEDKRVAQAALKKTALAISDNYGCALEQVWTTWVDLEAGNYLEGDTEAFSQPDYTHPPICELICFEGKSDKEIENLLAVTASTLSAALGIPNNIFITYTEAKSGKVIAGNGIVRK